MSTRYPEHPGTLHPIIWTLASLPKALRPGQLQRLLEDMEDILLARIAPHTASGDALRLYVYPAAWAQRKQVRSSCRAALKRLGVRFHVLEKKEAPPFRPWRFLVPLSLLIAGLVSIAFALPVLLELYGQPWELPEPLPRLLTLTALLTMLPPYLQARQRQTAQAQLLTLLAGVSALAAASGTLLCMLAETFRWAPPELSYASLGWLAGLAGLTASLAPQSSARESRMELKNPRYTVLLAGNALSVPLPLLHPGDVVRLAPGESTPAEGEIVEGSALLAGRADELGIGQRIPPLRVLQDGAISLRLLQRADTHLAGKLRERWQTLQHHRLPHSPLSLQLLAAAGGIALLGMATGLIAPVTALLTLMLMAPVAILPLRSHTALRQCLKQLQTAQLLPPHPQALMQGGTITRLLIHEQAFHYATPWQIRAIIPLAEEERDVLRQAASLHQSTPLALAAPLLELAHARRLRLLPVAEQQCLPAAGYLRGTLAGRILICVPETQLAAEGLTIPLLPEDTPTGERYYLADARAHRILGCIITSHVAMTAEALSAAAFQALGMDVWVVRYASPDLATCLPDAGREETPTQRPLQNLLEDGVPTFMLSNVEAGNLPPGIVQCSLYGEDDSRPLPQHWLLPHGQMGRLADALLAMRHYRQQALRREQRGGVLFGVVALCIFALQPPLPVIALLTLLLCTGRQLR